MQPAYIPHFRLNRSIVGRRKPKGPSRDAGVPLHLCDWRPEIRDRMTRDLDIDRLRGKIKHMELGTPEWSFQLDDFC